jgi:hypothetical protein
MSLQCPVCQKKIPAGDVNIGADLARCTACGEVFCPSATIPPGCDVAADEPPCPTLEPPPEGTKVRIEDQGGSLLVCFPPFGFNAAVVLLIVIAIVWWGYVSLFLGSSLGVWERLVPQSLPPQMALEAESPLESDPSIAEKQADRHGDPTEQDSGIGGVYGLFACLLMLPFIGVGLFMIWGILWQILGRTRVRLATDGCSYRRSLLGLGRGRTASLADTSVRWTDEPAPPGRRTSAASATPDRPRKRNEPHILLTLGGWATPLGGGLIPREQKRVFREMLAWLKRHAKRKDKPLPG